MNGLILIYGKNGLYDLCQDCVSKKVDRFLAFTDDGSGFVFGFLVTQQPFIPNRVASNDIAFNVTSAVNQSRAFTSVVVFKSLSVIYFFCFVANNFLKMSLTNFFMNQLRTSFSILSIFLFNFQQQKKFLSIFSLQSLDSLTDSSTDIWSLYFIMSF